MIITATAPANIALIKYMGKVGLGNLPSNASLSFTLDKYITKVVLQTSNVDSWEPLSEAGFLPIVMSSKSIERYLTHIQLLKEHFNIKGNFLIQSANNFASDCGLASSASSFAALTKATYLLAREYNFTTRECTDFELSKLSQKGSGSSCRSFYSGFVEWVKEGAASLDIYSENINHFVVVVSAAKKDVSSSQAHQRVLTSLNFRGRVERANTRLRTLKQALRNNEWRRVFEISLEEFVDMHELFETSSPPFSYRNEMSHKVISIAKNIWEEFNSGPVVTMDAGSNVHVLYRKEDEAVIREFKSRLTGYELFGCEL